MQKQLLASLRYLKNFLSRTMEKYDGRLAYIITAVVASIVFVGGVKLFIKLTEVLKTEYLASYDSSISNYVQQFRTASLTDYFVFVTDVGDTLGYLIIFTFCTLLFYILFKSWKYVAQFALIMILALSSNLILKQAINRARPDAEHLVMVETLSYPSGHAMMAMAFYGLLIYFVTQFGISKYWKTLLIILLVTLILSIGTSRIYLGVHYPSDVAGGFIAGFIWVVFCIMIFNLIKIFKRDPST
ncbi:phosphatase PAP2 family protein [Nonlabens agnitus]|uniref:Phosphatidic acid phosphatase n=1 Tax=Nonlabens agnitus TaxID=870484 RepID=A0A2S9WXS0_9FLAO|nr:phosphatase PAP2 family protein [Nonlabens agnitus]PRP68270.1 phosphatidic acid phosphatase [Nonlabens agnitus]